jgi:hypothetical protein
MEGEKMKCQSFAAIVNQCQDVSNWQKRLTIARKIVLLWKNTFSKRQDVSSSVGHHSDQPEAHMTETIAKK